MLNSEVAQYAKLNKISVSEAYSVSVLRIGGYLDGYQQGRADGVREFAELLKEKVDEDGERFNIYTFTCIDEVAEQLQGQK